MKYCPILIILFSVSVLANNCQNSKHNKHGSIMTVPLLTDQKGLEINSLLYLPWNEPHGLNRLTEAHPSTSVIDSNLRTQSLITSQYYLRVTGNGKKLMILSNNSGIKNEKPNCFSFRFIFLTDAEVRLCKSTMAYLCH